MRIEQFDQILNSRTVPPNELMEQNLDELEKRVEEYLKEAKKREAEEEQEDLQQIREGKEKDEFEDDFFDPEDFYEALDLLESCAKVLKKLMSDDPNEEYPPAFLNKLSNLSTDCYSFVNRFIVNKDEESEV